jgi:cytochrome P450
MGREADVETLVPDFDILDGAEAFVHPEAMANRDPERSVEQAALARVETAVAALLQAERTPSFLDEIAAKWEGADGAARGIAGDVVILHVATMTNLFAALAWTLAMVLLYPSNAPLEQCALEAIRLGQRSIMLREVLRPVEFAGCRIEPGVQLATMLPVTNAERVGDAFEPDRWGDRALHHDVTVTTFGHGGHRCPAQRFSVAAIVRTVARLQEPFDLTPTFDTVRALPFQIGGMARSAQPCPVSYVRRSLLPG